MVTPFDQLLKYQLLNHQLSALKYQLTALKHQLSKTSTVQNINCLKHQLSKTSSYQLCWNILANLFRNVNLNVKCTYSHSVFVSNLWSIWHNILCNCTFLFMGSFSWCIFVGKGSKIAFKEEFKFIYCITFSIITSLFTNTKVLHMPQHSLFSKIKKYIKNL